LAKRRTCGERGIDGARFVDGVRAVDPERCFDRREEEGVSGLAAEVGVAGMTDITLEGVGWSLAATPAVLCSGLMGAN
jgi:hypothetical protein